MIKLIAFLIKICIGWIPLLILQLLALLLWDGKYIEICDNLADYYFEKKK